jgi:4-hydroxy-tetrahydrodipicolinate reductase
MIRLAIVGAAGRMGARTCSLAQDDPRFKLVARIDLRGDSDTVRRLEFPCDVVIDFSSDEGARGAAAMALERHAALLVCTTGLSPQTLSVVEVASRSIAVMVAANTSAGAAVMSHLAAEAARLLDPAYHCDIIEIHHAAKRDAPSGTALRIAEAMRRLAGITLPPDRVHSIRAGDVVGEHTVEFAGPGERLRITHMATSRDLFALGALNAAAWLHSRPPGQYSIEQSLGL